MQNNSTKQVKIRPEIIERIKGRDDIKPLLAIALDLHRSSINRLLNENEVNGDLTKVSCITIMCQKLELDSEFVVEEVLQSEPCHE